MIPSCKNKYTVLLLTSTVDHKSNSNRELNETAVRSITKSTPLGSQGMSLKNTNEITKIIERENDVFYLN